MRNRNLLAVAIPTKVVAIPTNRTIPVGVSQVEHRSAPNQDSRYREPNVLPIELCDEKTIM